VTKIGEVLVLQDGGGCAILTPSTQQRADYRKGYKMNCTDCGMKIDQWCVFPQGRCINCHAIDFDSKPMPTAQEIRQMWGIK
jgi:hypothetical protein